jgi:hypothetical protein
MEVVKASEVNQVMEIQCRGRSSTRAQGCGDQATLRDQSLQDVDVRGEGD